MTTNAIYEEHGSDWSHQVSAVGTTRWLQHDQTLPLSAKGVACETRRYLNVSMQLPAQICKVGCQGTESTCIIALPVQHGHHVSLHSHCVK